MTRIGITGEKKVGVAYATPVSTPKVRNWKGKIGFMVYKEIPGIERRDVLHWPKKRRFFRYLIKLSGTTAHDLKTLVHGRKRDGGPDLKAHLETVLQPMGGRVRR